jgi:hypothetical protein
MRDNRQIDKNYKLQKISCTQTHEECNQLIIHVTLWNQKQNELFTPLLLQGQVPVAQQQGQVLRREQVQLLQVPEYLFAIGPSFFVSR